MSDSTVAGHLLYTFLFLITTSCSDWQIQEWNALVSDLTTLTADTTSYSVAIGVATSADLLNPAAYQGTEAHDYGSSYRLTSDTVISLSCLTTVDPGMT